MSTPAAVFEQRHVAADCHLRGTRLRQDVDGPAAGLRVLDLYARELRVEVLLDRAGDLGRVEYCGVPVSWTSSTGYVPGWRGAGTDVAFLSSFPGGLLATCGLEHAFSAEEEALPAGSHPHLRRQRYPLHGSLSTYGATLRGHGVKQSEEGAVVYCEVETTQSVFFAEHLRLHRRIELHESRREVVVLDSVVNLGPRPTEVMVDYHANFGYPLVSEGATVLGPQLETAHQQATEPALVCPAPQDRADETVRVIPLGDGAHALELWSADRSWGVRQSADGDLIRHHVLWEYFQSQQYVLGLEFASNDLNGRSEARRSGELTVAEPGRPLRNRISWRFLSGGNDSVVPAASVEHGPHGPTTKEGVGK